MKMIPKKMISTFANIQNVDENLITRIFAITDSSNYDDIQTVLLISKITSFVVTLKNLDSRIYTDTEFLLANKFLELEKENVKNS